MIAMASHEKIDLNEPATAKQTDSELTIFFGLKLYVTFRCENKLTDVG